MRVILASKSPRRSDILRMLGLREFDIIPSEADEPDCGTLPPGEAVELIARAKLAGCGVRDDNALIIASDTLVFVDGKPFGKPADAADAERMLRTLSGTMHSVYTGVAMTFGGRLLCRHERTDVFFRALTDKEIADYIASGEPFGKAGAYAAQGRASGFIRRIEGDFWNVVGLPACLVTQMSRELGAEIF